jgi:hypothetical protein
MNFDDQQLDELLKSVAVPADLRSRLQFSIDRVSAQSLADDPDAESSRSEVTRERWSPHNFRPRGHRQMPVWAIAFAVSGLILIGGAIVWTVNQFGPSTDQLAESLVPHGPTVSNETEHLAAQEMIDELDRQINAQKSVLLVLETQELLRKIEKTEKELAASLVRPRLVDPSLTLAYSAESSLRAGSSPTIVREDLKFVIDRFPNSSGAFLARELLANMN